MPAILSEGFFITNQNFYNQLISSSSDLLKDESQGIFEGIVNYFDNPDQIKVVKNDDSLVIDRTDLDD